MIAGVAFILCALTSLGCSSLLFRAYRISRARLLFWSALCFLGLALNNVLLFADVDVFPNVDLSIVRLIPALAGVGCLLYGLVMNSE